MGRNEDTIANERNRQPIQQGQLYHGGDGELEELGVGRGNGEKWADSRDKEKKESVGLG